MAERARNGDLEAMHFFEEYGKNLALALSHAIHILDPEMVVVGGGIGRSYELFMPIVKENLQELLSFISVDDIFFERAKSEESGALGAAYIAKEGLL
jgi:glucokinase